MPSALRRAGADQLRLLDAVALLWCVAWVVIGGWVGHEVWQLSHLGETLTTTGQALDDSGRALQELRDIPIIGGTPGTIGDSVREAATSIAARGGETRDSTRRLAVLLGVSVALLPLAPVLLYLPVRAAAAADRRRVLALLRSADGPDLDTHLARRALAEVPYETLQRTTPTPERDFAEGRRRHLADAQLEHLGLRRDPT